MAKTLVSAATFPSDVSYPPQFDSGRAAKVKELLKSLSGDVIVPGWRRKLPAQLELAERSRMQNLDKDLQNFLKSIAQCNEDAHQKIKIPSPIMKTATTLHELWRLIWIFTGHISDSWASSSGSNLDKAVNGICLRYPNLMVVYELEDVICCVHIKPIHLLLETVIQPETTSIRL